MGYKEIVLLAATGCCLFLSGCMDINSVKPKEAVPDWVQKVPREKGRLCAVGASEPTYYREDAKKYAAENARGELARSLHVNIKSIMVDITTEKGGDIAEGRIIEASSWASEAALKESEITSFWYDEEGVAPVRKKGVSYALACMPLKNTAQGISEKLNDTADTGTILDRLYKKVGSR